MGTRDLATHHTTAKRVNFGVYLQTTRENPPVTQSLVLESYLDEVKLDLSAATFTKPKDNLIEGEHKALKEQLKKNTKMLNLKGRIIFYEEGGSEYFMGGHIFSRN